MLYPTRKQWRLFLQRHIKKKQLKGWWNVPCINGNVREEALLLMIYQLFASSFTLTPLINSSPLKLSNKNGGRFNCSIMLPYDTKILGQYLFACTLGILCALVLDCICMLFVETFCSMNLFPTKLQAFSDLTKNETEFNIHTLSIYWQHKEFLVNYSYPFVSCGTSIFFYTYTNPLNCLKHITSTSFINYTNPLFIWKIFHHAPLGVCKNRFGKKNLTSLVQQSSYFFFKPIWVKTCLILVWLQIGSVRAGFFAHPYPRVIVWWNSKNLVPEFNEINKLVCFIAGNLNCIQKFVLMQNISIKSINFYNNYFKSDT